MNWPGTRLLRNHREQLLVTTEDVSAEWCD